MKLFARSKYAALSRFFSKLPGFSKPDKHSLYFLNIAQFMGVLNDNIFKLVTAFLLIDVMGKEHASSILSLAGAIFVIPFILFSATAGTLADRFSKQRLLVLMKAAEIILMSLAIIAFGFRSPWASYILLFCVATHSALFGPSKYAIISQLVPPDRVSRANGLITSFTYLGVILGTFLASFLTEITERHFALIAGFTLLVAIVGFISTFGIKYTPPQNSTKKISPLFIREIWRTLVFCRPRKHLLVAIFGGAYFLFIGAFAQLNIIPFAIQALNLSEIAGGYLFLSTALGIALGSYIAGKASKHRVELGLSCIACLGVGIFLLLLSLFSSYLPTVVIFLAILGIFGGLFIVPFDSFVQLYSPDEMRGQIIATNSFLSFCGVLVASGALYFYSEVLELSASAGFACTGFLSLIVSFFMTSRLSDLALPYMSKKLLKPFYSVKTENLELIEKNPEAILVLSKASWTKTLLLLSVCPRLHVFVPKQNRRPFPWFNWLFYSIHLIPSDASYKSVLEAAEELSSENVTPCLMVKDDALPETLQPGSMLANLFKFAGPDLLYADVDFSSLGTTIRISKR